MIPSDPARPWTRSPVLPPMLVSLVVVACFSPALSAGFVNWDDEYNFTANLRYRGLSPAHLSWMFQTFHLGHWHPLTWITLGIDFTLWGMNPLGYHLTSVLIHALNAALLFVVIRRLLALAGSTSTSPWPAAVGALFYAVHPLRVESVAWVTERRDVVCGFFTLLTLLAWLKRLEEERQGRPGTKWFVFAVAAFAAALMSKALAIMLPAVLLILDVYPLRRFAPGERGRRLLEKVPFGLISLADLALMLFAMREIQAVRSVESYNVVERLAQAAYGLAFYVVKTVWPSGLIPIHRLETPMDPFAAKYVAAAIGVAGVTGLLLAYRKRIPWGLTAWLCFGVLVLPVLGVAVTGRQLVADRYTYLALLPASFLVAAFLQRTTVPVPVAAAGVGLLLLALSAMTWRQCGFWKDSVTLWSRQIEFDPNYDAAWHDRSMARSKTTDTAGAMADIQRCLEINPRFEKAYNLRALLRWRTGDLAGARADYDRALELNPAYLTAWVNRGDLRWQSGDLAGAAGDFSRALELNPGHVTARINRGDLRRAQGDLEGALADAEALLRQDERATAGYLLRAGVLMRWNRPREALQDYERALALQGESPRVLVGRGQARMLLGDKPGAASDFERALRLAPPTWPLRQEVEAQLQRVR